MKTAIYIEDSVVQLVITPESKFEKHALEMFEEKPLQVEIFTGSFYDCRGGWVRQAGHFPQGVHSDEDRSLILKISEEVKNEPG